MAFWTRTQQQLPNGIFDQIQGIYGEDFPIEVRQFLASWIEAQTWDGLDPNIPSHESAIRELLLRFAREIDNKANSIVEDDLFLNRIKLTEFVSGFKQRCETNPREVFRNMRDCFVSEMKLCNFYENNMSQLPALQMSHQLLDVKGPIPPPPYHCHVTFTEINSALDSLGDHVQKSTEFIRKLDTEQEQIQIKYHEYQKICANLDHFTRHTAYDPQQASNTAIVINKLNQQKTEAEQNLNQRIIFMQGLQSSVVEKLKENVKFIDDLLKRLTDRELISWQRKQQYAANGGEFELNHLDVLQNWLENLAERIWNSLTQAKEAIRLIRKFVNSNEDVESNMNLSNLKTLTDTVTTQLRTIIIRTFIIEKQPPQVMKTNTRFSAKVRCLVGGKLGMNLHLPEVKVSIISEAQANALLTDKTLKGDGCGDILNCTGTMEFDQATKQLALTFRNMQLKKIKRAEKKGSESVVDEKFALYFSTIISIGNDFTCNVWALSLPVTVIVHGNQEPHAWATITWDNAFADPERKPFVVPEKVYWGKLAAALNLKFCSVTGRPLSSDNIKYLAEKLFRCQSDDFDTMQVSWALFSKESLLERSFTFWDWFYAIMKLTREHLKSLWVDGCILGFVRKKQAEDLLSNCPIGTFLLRFSDSELGGITIAWVETNSALNGEQPKVIMLQPFTAKDFSIRCLADRINDLAQLQTLYPNKPKHIAFGHYYTPFNEKSCDATNGYVKPQLVTMVPGSWNGQQSDRISMGVGSISSYPSTPNTTFHPNSPSDNLSFSSETPSFAGDRFSHTLDMIDMDFEL